jgi:Fe-S oxidoreductase
MVSAFMNKQNTSNVISLNGRTREPFGNLENAVSEIRETCLDCGMCRTECKFLTRYGTPWAILNANDPSDPAFLKIAYECSLCGLCEAVCPVGLHPRDLFLAMRRAAVSSGNAPLHLYKRLLAYEKRGTSKRYSYYSLPAKCDTVFFPGCALPGTRPGKTLALYDHLKTLVPNIGIVLDCCCKPSRDLGRTRHFLDMLWEMKSFLTRHGVRRIITACPNCHQVFNGDGRPIEVKSVYELLAKSGLPQGIPTQKQTVTVHDACVTRFDAPIQDAVRGIAVEKGVSVVEMLHSRKNTLCCGDGGSVEYKDPLLSDAWKTSRMNETAGTPVITYCAGCAQALKGNAPVFHIIDLLFDPGCLSSGKPRASRSPITYLNRLWLKRILQKREKPEISRERSFGGRP